MSNYDYDEIEMLSLIYFHLEFFQKLGYNEFAGMIFFLKIFYKS